LVKISVPFLIRLASDMELSVNESFSIFFLLLLLKLLSVLN